MMKIPDFSSRSRHPELMDSLHIAYDEFRDCLRTLELINFLTLGYRPTLQWLNNVETHETGALTIWDVGCGGGDMLRCLWRKAGNNRLSLVGIDINPWSEQAAAEATPAQAPIEFVTADVFSITGRAPPDFIISSLFTHHLSDEQLVDFLRWMDGRAAKGWFINDLHRHPLPYYFIKCTTRLLSRNRLIRHDAPVSVARSFTRADWQRLLARAGIAAGRYVISWHFPFRYCVGCRS